MTEAVSRMKNQLNMTTLILIVLVVITLSCFLETTRGNIITVDDDGPADHSSIRSAVENASAGDEILVNPGTYNEQVIIDKPLNLTGNWTNLPMVVGPGKGNGDVIIITSDWVNVSNLEVVNGDIGIGIEADHVTVAHCVCSSNSNGIDISGGHWNTITGNDCSGNEVGIYLSHSDRNTIQDTACDSNDFYGMYLFASENNVLSWNTCTNNGIGTYLRDSPGNSLDNLTLEWNTADGLRIDVSWDTVLETNTILDNVECGIKLIISPDVVISGCVVAGNDIGISIESSDDVTISDSEITENADYGIDGSGNENITALVNWWGDLSGPYHPALNTNGRGNRVSNDVAFDPWLTPEERDFSENVSFVATDTTGTGDPGEFVNYGIRIRNNASASYDLRLDTKEEPDGISIIFPSGSDVGTVNPGETVILSVIALIQEGIPPATLPFMIAVIDKNDPHLFKDLELEVVVNQVYAISANITETPIDNKLIPNATNDYLLEILNTGTGSDDTVVEIPREILGAPNIPDGWNVSANVTNIVLAKDERRTLRISVVVPMYAVPDPVSIDIWIHFSSGTQRITVTISSSVDVHYRPVFGISGDIIIVLPTYHDPGVTNFSITVTNEGNVQDVFRMEFASDASTNKYRYWMSLAPGVTLDPGESSVLQFSIMVAPLTTDPLAMADGLLKDITITAYSEEARSNDLEVPGETTDSFTARVDIREYWYAEIILVNPWAFEMDVDEIKLVNVTLANLGNGPEGYSFIKDGKNGGGQFTAWYEFLTDSVVLDPQTSRTVVLRVAPAHDAPVGIHDLEFHAKSEMTFTTSSDFIRVDILEKFGGMFISGSSKNSDPGRTVDMSLTVRNTGNEDHDFRMDDPILPDGWPEPGWSGGNQKSIPADSSGTFTIRITIPSDFPKAEAGLYQFMITGDYEDEGGSWTRIPGFVLLNLTVNTVYGVEVNADDTVDSGKPGETVSYQFSVKNTGNTDETYQLNVLRSGSGGDAKPWTTIKGLLPGNQVRIPTGETRYLDVEIVIPDFTVDNDDAEKGLYGFKVKAESTNESTEVDEIIFELDVEEMYRVRIWADISGKNETLKENDPTEMTYTLFVRNLGNTDDDIVITVPNDEFAGEKKDWSVKFGTQSSKTVTLDSLRQQSITLSLTIDKNTDPGEYTLRVRAESQGDTAVYDYFTLYINLSKASYGVKLEKVVRAHPRHNPSEKSEVEFWFILTNVGNQDDTYTVEVETPLGSGPYKNWIMEFENDDYERVDTLTVPTEVPGSTDLYMRKGEWIDITLYVVIAIDEDEGLYEDIIISATSDNDNSQVAYLYFNLTVILPNIRVSDDPGDFSINPYHGIEEGDDVDIFVRLFNDGSAPTGEFYVWSYNGKSRSGNEIGGTSSSGLIGNEKVDNIPAGQYYNVFITWEDIEGGENDIYVYADKPIKSGDGKTFINNVFSSDGLVLESKENDNTASIDDDYQEAIDLRPDLTITRVEVDDPERDTTTTVTVTVENIGSAKALQGSGTVSLKIGGTSIKADTPSFKGINPFLPENIDVNDDIDIEFTWEVPDEIRNFTIKVNVDHPDDSDSSNDRYSSYVRTEEQDSTDEIVTQGWGLLLIGLILAVATILGVAWIVSRNLGSMGGQEREGKDIPGKGKPPAGGPRKSGVKPPQAGSTTPMKAPPRSPSPQPPSARLISLPVVNVEFPVIDRCLGCGAKLRVYKPGLIGCPYCHATAMVDKRGRFYGVETNEGMTGGGGAGKDIVPDTRRQELEGYIQELQRKLDHYKYELEGSGNAVGVVGGVYSPHAPAIEDGMDDDWDEEDHSFIEDYDELRAPHWETNELVRKRKILKDYTGYEEDPKYEGTVNWLRQQINVMETYGRRNVMGFPDTTFIANKKEELKSIFRKPKQWHTPDEKQILRSYPPKIRAFEKIVGMTVEELLVELKEERERENLRHSREDSEAHRLFSGTRYADESMRNWEESSIPVEVTAIPPDIAEGEEKTDRVQERAVESGYHPDIHSDPQSEQNMYGGEKVEVREVFQEGEKEGDNEEYQEIDGREEGEEGMKESKEGREERVEGLENNEEREEEEEGMKENKDGRVEGEEGMEKNEKGEEGEDGMKENKDGRVEGEEGMENVGGEADPENETVTGDRGNHQYRTRYPGIN